MFFFLNIRIFKIKLSNYISFAINSLNTLKYKNIKIYYNLFNFEYFYLKFITFFIFFYLIVICL